MSSLVSSSLAAALAFCTAAACASPPPDELIQDFDWEVSRVDMRDALLGSCSYNGVLYAAGGQEDAGLLMRWVGRRWIAEPVFPAAALRACWAGPGNIVLAVGQRGGLYRRNLEGWRDESVLANYLLHDVTGFGNGTAIAVGQDGDSPLILHYDPEELAWTPRLLPAEARGALYALWAASSTQVWAVGAEGTVLSFDGEEWQLEESATSKDLHAIHGASGNEIFAAGQEGILRRDGASWSMFVSTDDAINTLWTAAERPLYAGGDSSYLLRIDRMDEAIQADLLEERRPDATLCPTDLVGLSQAVFATAVNCENQGGAMLSHGRSFAGPLFIARP